MYYVSDLAVKSLREAQHLNDCAYTNLRETQHFGDLASMEHSSVCRSHGRTRRFSELACIVSEER